jgi:gelsolin
MSFSPDRVRVRGRSPAFNALAANFENPNARNLSTPPPVVRKQLPKPVSPESSKPPPRTASIAAISASFERPKATLIPKSIKGMLASLERIFYISSMFLLHSIFFWCQASPDANKPQTEASKPKPETNAKESNPTKDNPAATPTVQEDVKESQAEGEEGLLAYPYDRLRTSSTNPATDIDVTKREVNPDVLMILA